MKSFIVGIKLDTSTLIVTTLKQEKHLNGSVKTIAYAENYIEAEEIRKRIIELGIQQYISENFEKAGDEYVSQS